ncbi:MAG: triose-phosphate isomerase [bacterium]|nr:triose-phosphate isomerase [bacterium]
MRIPLIAGNWKMHKTVRESVDFARGLLEAIGKVNGVEVAVAPPFTALHPVAEVLKGGPIRLAAQNIFWEESGAYTGETSGPMLAEAGCSLVIIGHSERRQYFGETDETVNRRLFAALAAGLHPIVCIGETLEQRQAGQTFEVVASQLEGGLTNAGADQTGSVVIAYEPVWAIGTGVTATPEQAEEVHHFIRQTLAERYGEGLAQTTRILYGGSVKPDNIRDLMACENIDGALVGGASLEIESFAAIVGFNKG